MDLKVGDIVKLKTGGPKMTVNKVGIVTEGLEVASSQIETIWFQPSMSASAMLSEAASWDGPFFGEFNVGALEKVSAP